MELNKKLQKMARSYTNSFHKERNTLKKEVLSNIYKEKDTTKTLNFHKVSMKSDNKIINFSEMIPKLLEQIKVKNSSRHNIFIDNISNSFVHDSNSSELNDDKESENDINNTNSKGNNSPKKIPKLIFDKNEENNEYKKLEVPATYRQKRKADHSPTVQYPRKYSKENKDSLVLKLHKYFFQDGEIENIDTLIKYNINKIKINNNYNNEDNSTKNLDVNVNNDKEFNYFNIKQEVINLMDKFASAFDKENKSQLVSAIKDLNKFSDKHKFDYVTQLTLDWLIKIQGKKYDNCELKYIGYYNQIRDIMDAMLKELKRKADLIIINEQKKIKENNKAKNENNSGVNDKNNSTDNMIKSHSIQVEVPSIMINKNLQKKSSINKEDIFRTKEIVPIKIDIEVQKTLDINEVEEILKNLDEGDLGNLGSKSQINNNKKILNRHPSNRNGNELEAFSYPFKEYDLCNIF
jgi:hypothetical protein